MYLETRRGGEYLLSCTEENGNTYASAGRREIDIDDSEVADVLVGSVQLVPALAHLDPLYPLFSLFALLGTTVRLIALAFATFIRVAFPLGNE